MGTAIVAGIRIAVRGQGGDWIGHVRGINDLADKNGVAWASVAVVDPLDSGLRVGDVFRIPHRRLGALPRVEAT